MTDIVKKEILENLSTYRFYVPDRSDFLDDAYQHYRLLRRLSSARGELQHTPSRARESDKIILPPEPLSIFARGSMRTPAGSTSSRPGGSSAAEPAVDKPCLIPLQPPRHALCHQSHTRTRRTPLSFDAVCGKRNRDTQSHTGRGIRRPPYFSASSPEGICSSLSHLCPVPDFIDRSVAPPGCQAGNEYWIRLAIILAGSALYGGVLCCAGTLISSLVQRAPRR